MIKYYRGEIMGIFGKIKNLFKKEDEEEQVKKYDEGLSKTRKNFVEKILNINNPNTGIKTYSLIILFIIFISYLIFKKKKSYIR